MSASLLYYEVNLCLSLREKTPVALYILRSYKPVQVLFAGNELEAVRSICYCQHRRIAVLMVRFQVFPGVK